MKENIQNGSNKMEKIEIKRWKRKWRYLTNLMTFHQSTTIGRLKIQKIYLQQ
jgi:hypothetical protein